ncbi:hypothetical protein SBV1_2300037 [Verrucomicrobia bacterium]|nr:hypothetical protein SBV1_2300037 [Verrucomicrobiota bacterium]
MGSGVGSDSGLGGLTSPVLPGSLLVLIALECTKRHQKTVAAGPNQVEPLGRLGELLLQKQQFEDREATEWEFI